MRIKLKIVIIFCLWIPLVGYSKVVVNEDLRNMDEYQLISNIDSIKENLPLFYKYGYLPYCKQRKFDFYGVQAYDTFHYLTALVSEVWVNKMRKDFNFDGQILSRGTDSNTSFLAVSPEPMPGENESIKKMFDDFTNINRHIVGNLDCEYSMDSTVIVLDMRNNLSILEDRTIILNFTGRVYGLNKVFGKYKDPKKSDDDYSIRYLGIVFMLPKEYNSAGINIEQIKEGLNVKRFYDENSPQLNMPFFFDPAVERQLPYAPWTIINIKQSYNWPLYD